MRKSNFTLLEMMIALLLLSIIGSLVGIRTVQGIEVKEFQVAVEGLRLELESCRQQALNTQADWWVNVEICNKRMLINHSCPEMGLSKTSDWKAPFRLSWNGEPTQKIVFLFSSTGKIEPIGRLVFAGSKKHLQWDIPQLFHVLEGADDTFARPKETLKKSF
jgi:prepilin-type N-terminal cleavage/methylation domain-containing protein